MDTIEHGHGIPIPGPNNYPAPELVACGPDTVISDPCGCNAPDAFHQRGDQAFCRVTLIALGAP